MNWDSEYNVIYKVTVKFRDKVWQWLWLEQRHCLIERSCYCFSFSSSLFFFHESWGHGMGRKNSLRNSFPSGRDPAPLTRYSLGFLGFQELGVGTLDRWEGRAGWVSLFSSFDHTTPTLSCNSFMMHHFCLVKISLYIWGIEWKMQKMGPAGLDLMMCFPGDTGQGILWAPSIYLWAVS